MNSNSLKNGLIYFFLFAVIFYFVKNTSQNIRERRQAKKTERVEKHQSTPSYYEKQVLLKKGEVVTVQIPRNYYYGLDGGGQKYYRQAYHKTSQSYGERELIGGGLPVKNTGSDISHLRLSPYQQEIVVTVIFSKDKSLIK